MITNLRMDLFEALEVTRTSVTSLLLQLGFPGARGITNGGMFGYTPDTIWMDNLYCYGTEHRLEDCR